MKCANTSFIACLCLLPVCRAAQEFRIGCVTSLTGRFDRSRAVAVGLLLAEQLINGPNDDGIQLIDNSGRSSRVKLRIELHDDESIASRHESMLRAMLVRAGNPVHALVGGTPAFSNIDISIANEFGRVLVHPQGVTPLLTSSVSAGMSISLAPAPSRASVPALLAFAQSGASRIAILGAGNDPVTKSCAAGARAAAERLHVQVEVFGEYVAGRDRQSDWGWAYSWQSGQAIGLPTQPTSPQSADRTRTAATRDAQAPLSFFQTDTRQLDLLASEIQEKEVDYLVMCGFGSDTEHLLARLAEASYPLKGVFGYPAPLALEFLERVRADYAQLLLASALWSPAAAVDGDPLLGDTDGFIAAAVTMQRDALEAASTDDIPADQRLFSALQLVLSQEDALDVDADVNVTAPEVISTRQGYGELSAMDTELLVLGGAAASTLLQAWGRAIGKCQAHVDSTEAAWLPTHAISLEAWSCDASSTTIESLPQDLVQNALCEATYRVAWGPGALPRALALEPSHSFNTSGTSAAGLQRYQLELASFLCGLPPSEAAAFEPGADSRAIDEPRTVTVRAPVMAILQELRSPYYPTQAISDAADAEQSILSPVTATGWNPIRTIAGDVVLDSTAQNSAAEFVLLQALATRANGDNAKQGFLQSESPGKISSSGERIVRDLGNTKYTALLHPTDPSREERGEISDSGSTRRVILPCPMSSVLGRDNEWTIMTRTVVVLLVLGLAATAAALLVARDLNAMRSLPPHVWGPILCGLCVLAVWPAMFVGSPGNWKCHARQWMRGIAVDLVLAPMMAILMHHRQVVDAPTRYQEAFPTLWFTLAWVVAGLALEALGLTIQSIGGPVELYRGQCAWVHPASSLLWWSLLILDCSLLVSVLLVARLVAWAPSKKAQVQILYETCIQLMCLAGAVSLLCVLRHSGAWSGGLASEALVRLLLVSGTVVLLPYALVGPFLRAAFIERKRQLMDERGRILDVPPGMMKPPNLRGLSDDLVHDPKGQQRGADTGLEGTINDKLGRNGESRESWLESQSSEEASLKRAALPSGHRGGAGSVLAGVTERQRSNVSREGTGTGTSRGLDISSIGAGSTGLNLRARYTSSLEQQLKEKNASISRLQESIVALRGSLHLAKEDARQEADERALAESRGGVGPGRSSRGGGIAGTDGAGTVARSATPLTTQAIQIALARAQARHRKLSLVDYGNQSMESRPASRAAALSSSSAGDLMIANHGDRLPTPLQELARQFSGARQLALPAPGHLGGSSEQAHQSSSHRSSQIQGMGSTLNDTRRYVERHSGNQAVLAQHGDQWTSHSLQMAVSGAQTAIEREADGRAAGRNSGSLMASPSGQHVSLSTGSRTAVVQTHRLAGGGGPQVQDLRAVMPASLASMEAALAFARIRAEVARTGGTDGRLAGPTAELQPGHDHNQQLQGSGSCWNDARADRVSLLYDSEEEDRADAEEGVNEQLRVRRSKLRAKWRGKGSGILSASLQREARKAQRASGREAMSSVRADVVLPTNGGGGVGTTVLKSQQNRGIPGAVSAEALRALQLEVGNR